MAVFPNPADASLNRAFLGKAALDLADLLAAQAREVYIARGMIFPVAASSTLLSIADHAPVSQAALADMLGRPHQTVAQKLRDLARLDLVQSEPSPDDARVSLLRLTAAGLAQADALRAYCIDAAAAFAALFDETGTDVSAALAGAVAALKRRHLADRLAGGDKP